MKDDKNVKIKDVEFDDKKYDVFFTHGCEIDSDKLDEDGNITLNWITSDNKIADFKCLSLNIANREGIDNKSDFMAKNIKTTNDTNEFDIEYNQESTKIKIGIPTTPFIYNSLIAFAVGTLNNVKKEDIKAAIANIELSKNRLSKHVNKKGITIIDDTYNASFDSMKMALEILSKEKGRKVAILGDMLELGKYSQEIHTKVGQEIKNNNIDILITVGEESKYIEKEAINDGFIKENTYHFKNAEECYNNLNKILKEKDVVLLKASHSIGLTNVVNKLISE